MTARPCPQCGAPLDVQRGIVVDEPYYPAHPLRHAPLPRRQRTAAAVAFCTRCEYVDEVDAALAPHEERSMTKKQKAPTGETLAAQAPQGWTATHGTGYAHSWEQAEDDGWMEREKPEPGRTWVRFDYVDGDLHAVVALNVSRVPPGKFNRYDRERMWHGRTVEGHTMYNGRSFTRHGIDCSSCKLTDLESEHAYAHTYGALDALLAGELQRCREAHERSKTMVDVPGLPGGWRVTPTRREALSLSLRGGGIAEFRPHGMGVGYVVFTGSGRANVRRSLRRGVSVLPAATAEFFGVPGPLYYETTDCD